MDRKLEINGVYKHFKGDMYIVLDVATYSEDNSKLVIYRGLYGNNELYARPYELFMSEVDRNKYPNVKQKYRFELQKIESKNIKN